MLRVCSTAARVQELKTAQQELPDKVADALTAADWLRFAGTSHDETFSVPGLTLTSFHLLQLQRLKLVQLLRHNSQCRTPAMSVIVSRRRSGLSLR